MNWPILLTRKKSQHASVCFVYKFGKGQGCFCSHSYIGLELTISSFTTIFFSVDIVELQCNSISFHLQIWELGLASSATNRLNIFFISLFYITQTNRDSYRISIFYSIIQVWSLQNGLKEHHWQLSEIANVASDIKTKSPSS